MHGTEYQDTLEAPNIFLIWNFRTLVLCKLMYSFCTYRARAAAAQRQARDAEGGNGTSDGEPKKDQLVLEICVICLEQEYNAVFVPCGHMCCCMNCSSHVTNCPLCRRRIDQAVRTFRHWWHYMMQNPAPDNTRWTSSFETTWYFQFQSPWLPVCRYLERGTELELVNWSFALLTKTSSNGGS